MRKEKLRQIIYIGLMHSIAAGARKYKVGVMSQETPCNFGRIKEWPFIPSCGKKRIWLISQPTISVIYFPNTSSVYRGRDGELFSSSGGAEHVRKRQHQRRPPLTMDPGHGLKIATRSPGGTHEPAPKPENTHSHTHTLLQSSGLEVEVWLQMIRTVRSNY